MQRYNLVTYQRDDKYLVLNPAIPAWIVTNLTGAIAVLAYNENRSIDKAIDLLSSIDRSIDKNPITGFLSSDSVSNLFKECSSENKYKRSALRHIYLNMTSACNLQCTYCYAASRIEYGSNVLKYSDYTRLLDDLISMSFSGRVTFTGGEPLLSPNTLTVAEYAKRKGLKTCLLTNATLIQEDNATQICKVFDEFQISMDGSSSTLHDHYRGEGSYEKTVRAIELLKANNAQYRIAMTVTRDNSNDVSNMSKRWGGHLLFQPLFPLGRAEKNNSALSGIEYYNVLRNGANVTPFSNLWNVASTSQRRYRCYKCAIADAELSISCTGDVYPCQLLHRDSFLLGNIHDHSIVEIYDSKIARSFQNHTVDLIEGCKDCDFRYLCGGACQARHFSETGSISIAGEFCAYEKEGIVRGLIENCEMAEIDIHQVNLPKR